MTHEVMVGLTVIDEAGYQRYRDAMTPILQTYGGGFRYDFRIGEVLKSASEHPINRVFAIYFADRTRMEAFFADPAYVAVKAEHFESAVAGTTIFGGYDR